MKTIAVPIPTIILTSILLLILSFYSGLSLARSRSLQNNNPKIDSSVVFSPKKQDKAELKFFVMSFCPYGNQMEQTLRSVFDLLGDKVNITPHYIFSKIDNLDNYCQSQSGDINQCSTYVQNKYFKSIAECQKVVGDNLAKCHDDKAYLKSSSGAIYASLHGRQEATQNIREMCAWNIVGDNKKQWWDFVGNVNKNCTPENADSCWTDQAKQAGLDTTAITDCFNKDGLSLVEKEIEQTTKFNISSSPTLLINDQSFPPEDAYTPDNRGTLKIGKKVATQDKYRTPNVIKEAICIGAKSTPKECNTILNELTGTAPAAGGCGI